MTNHGHWSNSGFGIHFPIEKPFIHLADLAWHRVREFADETGNEADLQLIVPSLSATPQTASSPLREFWNAISLAISVDLQKWWAIAGHRLFENQIRSTTWSAFRHQNSCFSCGARFLYSNLKNSDPNMAGISTNGDYLPQLVMLSGQGRDCAD